MTEAAARLARASAMLDLNRYDQAASLLAQMVAADPGDSRAWCLLGVAQLRAGRNEEAAAAAERAISAAPSDDWPFRVASTAQVRLGDTAKAVATATEACKLAPGQWRAHLCLAQAALAAKSDLGAAGAAAANARRLGPNEPEAHFVAGKISFARGDRKAARAHQERVLALDPSHAGALNELGRIKLRRRAGNSVAARHFIQAAASAPDQGVYGRNVAAVVRRTLAQVIYLAFVTTFVVGELLVFEALPRPPLLLLLAAIAVLGAAIGAVRLQRMPRQTRPLMRGRRAAVALALAFVPLLAALAVAAAAPVSARPTAGLAVIVFAGACQVAARVLVRGKKSSPAGQATAS